MWALDAEICKVTMIPTLSSDVSPLKCKNSFVTKNEATVPNPVCEAARMASLKKLRHRLVVISNEEDEKKNGCKSAIPVLSFERWLARYALRRQNKDTTNSCKLHDPLIPSDGHIDVGLIKDLSARSMSPDDAERIALTLAKEGKKAATSIMEIHSKANTNYDKRNSRTIHKKEIKEQLRQVKKISKSAISALEEAIQNDDSDNNNVEGKKKSSDSNNNPSSFSEKIRDTLKTLRSATETFQESILKAQSDNKNMMLAAYKNDPKNPMKLCGGISINGARREGIYDITLKGPNGKPNRPYLTVSKLHLSKLIHLWMLRKKQKSSEHLGTENSDIRKNLHTFEEISQDPIEFLNAMSKEDQPQIRKTIYCCLSRYEALRGAGYQCAVPGNVFQAAATKCGLGATIECFASPLNCRYRNYCSAFPDIETSFGSIGNFFDDEAFNPKHGSYEANPPFVPETMFAMGKKIQRILDDQNRGPLSFLVIVPAWGGGCDNDNNSTNIKNSNPNNFCHLLEQSCHTRAKTRVTATNHAFYDGSQHTRATTTKPKQKVQSHLLRPSSWDTAVILMQNDAGRRRWPVDETVLKESLCGAFEDAATEMPEDANSIQKWEERGLAKGGSSRNKHYQHDREDKEKLKDQNERNRSNKKRRNLFLQTKERKTKRPC